MKSIIVSLSILLAIAVLSGDAKVTQPPPPTSTDNSQDSLQAQLNAFVSQAQTNVNNMAKQIQEQLNLPDQETLVRTVKEQSSNFVTNLQTYMQNMTQEVQNKQPELEAMWNDIKVKLNKAVEDVSSGLPNAQQQLADLQAKFQQGVQVLLKESDTAAKSLGEHSGKLQEDLAKITKQVVDIGVQATQNLNTQLQQAAAASTATKN